MWMAPDIDLIFFDVNLCIKLIFFLHLLGVRHIQPRAQLHPVLTPQVAKEFMTFPMFRQFQILKMIMATYLHLPHPLFQAKT